MKPVPQGLADEIVAWISDGKTLREFCRQEGKPSYGAVYDWIEKDAEFASRFAGARIVGEELIAQECLVIADDSTNDYVQTKFGPQLNAEHVQRSKLRIETRLKLLAKWNPKKYGDKLTVDADLKVTRLVVHDELPASVPVMALPKPEFEE